MIAVDSILGDVEPPATAPDGVELFRSRFAADGCLQFLPVYPRVLTERDVLRLAYRAMWLAHFAGEDQHDGEQETIESTLAAFASSDLGQVCTELADAFSGMATIGARGIAHTRTLLQTLRGGGTMKDAKGQVAELMHIDEELKVHGELHAACRPLTQMGRYERDNLEGNDPLELAEQTQRIYTGLENRATLMREKLEHIAALSRERVPA